MFKRIAAALTALGLMAGAATAATTTMEVQGDVIASGPDPYTDYTFADPGLNVPSPGSASLQFLDSSGTAISFMKLGPTFSGAISGRVLQLFNAGSSAALNLSLSLFDGARAFRLAGTSSTNTPAPSADCGTSLAAGASCSFLVWWEPPIGTKNGLYNDFVVADYQSAVVPLPPAAPLLLAGLGALVLIRRNGGRRNRAA